MKVILGGIVRNIENHIQQIFTFIFTLKQVIPSLEVCLYENNSSDKTKELLIGLKNHLNFVSIKCEDYSEEYFFSFPARTYKNEGCRIHKIAFARNKLLEMINEKQSDFIIMMDLDIKILPDVNIIAGLIQQMNINKDIHALFANGIMSNGHYYDGYEFRSEQLPFGPEILGEKFWSDENMAKIQHKYEPNQQLIPVISAFGGLAIYNSEVIKDCFYSADITDELKGFYSKFEIEKPSQTHYNGCSLGIYIDNIFYKNNSGYNYPVCAEHVNFHLAIRAKGFKNMFICPALYYYWD
jgi:hypothetical protein